MEKAAGGFTLPGESGYEQLTLDLATRWGADVLRDSDGTALSTEIVQAGYRIYSTVCVIREHNAWLKSHPDCRQQTLLMSQPVTAEKTQLAIFPLEGYSKQQFSINATEEAMPFWQVFDRTTGTQVQRSTWEYCAETQQVILKSPQQWHTYTVNFFAWRVWEEISMYNHITNHWENEHLLQLDPRSEKAQAYLLRWMKAWCETHTDTDVVRFTSLFYNFVWIWGDHPRNTQLFSDWASYDFTVSPNALHSFQKEYGYALCAEDFINQGMRHPCHMAANQRMRDYISFTNRFVVSLGRQLVEIVHAAHKQAYLFYDDSWVGTEPGSEHFAEFGFDGIIKCVFSGYEARLCAEVTGVQTHELRLHPYLFPVGLGGAPTFAQGGHPAQDAKKYWAQVRRALMRVGVDRIGLGGYLHLVEQYPDFVEAVTEIAQEFRTLRELHKAGAPLCLPGKIGIVTTWGKLRRWTCGGHYHEHPDLDLINLLESLSGLPYEVEFFSFEELEKEIPSEVKIMINAGFAGSAWSGGDAWNHVRLIEKLTQWVHQGGIYFGVGEPSAQMRENGVSFQMAHVLGVDKKRDCMLCHGTWQTEKKQNAASPFEAVLYPLGTQVQISAEGTQVLAQTDAHLQATMHPFGSGKGVYFCGYRHTDANAYALLQCLQFLMGQPVLPQAVTNTPWVTCAIYPAARRAVFANSSEDVRSASAQINGKSLQCVLQAYQMKTVPLPDTEDFEEIPSPMTLAAFGQRANTHALQKALQFLSQANLAQLKPGRYAIDGDAVYASVQLYQTGFADENRYESHRNYIDVQYVISGEEQIGCAALAEMPKGAYDAANDITYYQDPPVEAQKMLCLRAGELVILPPQIAHKPCCIAKKAQPVKKVVVKVLRFHG